MRIFKNRRRADEHVRTTRFGLPVREEVDVAKKVTQKDANITPYGGKRFREPVRKGEFTGTRGTRPTAVILDIDGTVQGWGTGLQKNIEDYLAKHHKAGDVFVVITARTHEHDYARSFNWLMQHLPYPFIGPFHRSADDPRYASEFKRELAEDLSAVFEFVGAADDNTFVLAMWRQWAVDHFEDPADFDIFEAGYGTYDGWRKDLPSKGYSSWGTPATKAPAKKTYYGDYGGRYQSSYPPFSASVKSDKDDDWGWGEYDAWEGSVDDREERIESRLDLEDDVLASYPELTEADVEQMDIEVLRQMVSEAVESPETAPLDVEEIFEEDTGATGSWYSPENAPLREAVRRQVEGVA